MNCDLTKSLRSFIDLFNAGMDRANKDILSVGLAPAPGAIWLNFGAGSKQFTWAKSLQLPEWNAEVGVIPAATNSVDGIIAFHFFEHITSSRIPLILEDCLRVLKVGGTLTICVPHRLGGMAFQDLDHKSFFTENTWRILMENEYYKTKWNHAGKFEIRFNLIAGDSERTLALFTQMVKR